MLGSIISSTDLSFLLPFTTDLRLHENVDHVCLYVPTRCTEAPLGVPPSEIVYKIFENRPMGAVPTLDRATFFLTMPRLCKAGFYAVTTRKSKNYDKISMEWNERGRVQPVTKI